jgi:hypothetical protein
LYSVSHWSAPTFNLSIPQSELVDYSLFFAIEQNFHSFIVLRFQFERSGYFCRNCDHKISCLSRLNPDEGYDTLSEISDIWPPRVYVPSMESELIRAFPNIVNLPQGMATRTIKLTFDCCRRHPSRAKRHEIAPVLSDIYNSSLQRYQTLALPIIAKAIQQKLI